MGDNTKIIAVVITYNPDAEALKNQYQQLRNQVSRILYVDNGSKDEEVLNIITDFEKSDLIEIENNIGIASAQNKGIQIANEIEGTHVLLLDQDSIPEPGMVDELLMALESNPTAGASGVQLVDAFNRQQESYGIRIEGLKLKKINLTERFTEVSYMIASGTLIPLNVLKNVGGMLDDFFIDGVDFEWCLRAAHKGYKIIQCRDARLIHQLGNGSSDRVLNHSPLREYYIMRNSLRMIKLAYIPAGYRWRRGLMSVGRILTNLIKLRKEYLLAEMKAIKDAF